MAARILAITISGLGFFMALSCVERSEYEIREVEDADEEFRPEKTDG
jgi:hypothetical protein